MGLVAVVFVRRSGADGVGHVGWAFDCGDSTFLAGSVENPRHSLHTSPQQMGFWTIRTRDPIIPMRERAYHELKVVDLDQSDPAYAAQVVAWLSHKPYDVFGHNCMNVTYDVLRAFGVPELPAPAHHWEPNHWFNHVRGQHYKIDAGDVAFVTDGRGRAPVGLDLPDLDSLHTGPHTSITPAVPTWRTPNTPEWAELQSALAAAPPMPTTKEHANGIMGWIRSLFGSDLVHR